MLKLKTLNRLLLITGLIAIPLILSFMNFGGSANKHKNEVLFVELSKNIDKVASVTIKNQEQSLTLVRNETGWGLQDRNNFPVETAQVQELLAAIASLKIVEAKTENSLLYDQLDLADLSKPNSKAWQITLADADNNEVASFLIGKREAFQVEEKFSERIFVRKTAEQQSWLVQGVLPLHMNISDWLDQPLLDLLDTAQIKKVIMNKFGDQPFTIVKADIEQEDFILENEPTKLGMKLDVDAVNAMPFEVAELEFIDVLPADQRQLDWSKSLSARIETFPGLALDLNIVQDEDKVYAKFVAKADDLSSDEVKQQAATFNTATQNWYYNLTPELYNSIALSATDFLQVNEPVIEQPAA